MASEETSALPPKARMALAKALSDQRRTALTSCKARAARLRACGGQVDAEEVVDALEHSFTLCVMHQLERERASSDAAAAGGAAANARPKAPADKKTCKKNGKSDKSDMSDKKLTPLSLGGCVSSGAAAEAEVLWWRYRMLSSIRRL